jgi:hypothetical protein
MSATLTRISAIQLAYAAAVKKSRWGRRFRLPLEFLHFLVKMPQTWRQVQVEEGEAFPAAQGRAWPAPVAQGHALDSVGINRREVVNGRVIQERSS